MRTLIKILFIGLFLTSLAYSAQVIRYVDPDAPGPAHDGTSWNDAYLSLSAWVSGESPVNLVTDGDYHTCYCRSSKGTDDTTACSINGFVTDATHYIEIIGTDFPTDGVFDDSAYVMHNNDDSDWGLRILDDYIRIHNIQFKVTDTAADYRLGLYVTACGAAEIRVDSCIFKGVCSGSGPAAGIYFNDSSVTFKVYNCIVYDFVSGADADYYGILNGNSSNTYIYNCTVYNCYNGIKRIGGTLAEVKNCAVGNCTDDFDGAVTTDYCCSDDGDGNNAQNPSGGNWDNEYVTPGTDFDLEAGGNCVGNGTDDPGSGLYSDDIIGNARSSTWDIGAFEYQAPAGGTGAQVIIISKDGTPSFNDWWQFYNSLDD